MRRLVVTVVTGLSLAGLVGCGSGATVRTRATTPSDPAAVLFRVDTRGGFTSADRQLALVPQVTVYADGRVVVAGPTTDQFPPHALPNLLAGRLGHEAVARLVDRAVRGDLARPHDYGDPGVSDLPTTVVTVAVTTCGADASCVEPAAQRAYALDFTPRAGDPGVTAEQRTNRRRLRTFVRELDAAATPAATAPYRPTGVAVYSQPVRPDDTTADIVPETRDWPLADLATTGTPVGTTGFRCVTFSGADAAGALGAAGTATAITRWRSGAAVFTLVWRPLLRDEHACPRGP